MSVENVAGFKYRVSFWLMKRSTFLAYVIYTFINLFLVMFAASIVLWVAPEAAGSGIAEVKVGRAMGGAIWGGISGEIRWVGGLNALCVQVSHYFYAPCSAPLQTVSIVQCRYFICLDTVCTFPLHYWFSLHAHCIYFPYDH